MRAKVTLSARHCIYLLSVPALIFSKPVMSVTGLSVALGFPSFYHWAFMATFYIAENKRLIIKERKPNPAVKAYCVELRDFKEE